MEPLAGGCMRPDLGQGARHALALSLTTGLAAATTLVQTDEPAVSEQRRDSQPAPRTDGDRDADMRKMHEQMMRDHAQRFEMCQRMMGDQDMRRMHNGMRGGGGMPGDRGSTQDR